MKSLVNHLTEAGATQREALSGQVENSAGGFSYPVTPWTRLLRFLVLGTEGGTYYASERKQTREEIKSVAECLALDPVRTVAFIADVSDKGRAPKNDYAILALAMVAAHEDAAVRQLAYLALPRVCRIGTHLFQFVTAINALRGWSRGLRTAVSNWYTEKDDQKLALQLLKYQSRDGMSHRDVMRLAHPKPVTPAQEKLFTYSVKGWDGLQKYTSVPRILAELRKLHQDPTVQNAVRLIRDLDVPRECLPTSVLDAPAVWDAMLPTMPMTALLRNLANMTRIGLLTPMAPQTALVIKKLTDQDALRKARIHPLQVLVASFTYQSGHGFRSDKSWKPIPQITAALEEAFYLAFGAVETTGKRFYLGLDISGSMSSGDVGGVPGFTPRIASAALAMVTAQTETQYLCRAFTCTTSDPFTSRRFNTGMEDFPLNKRDRLATVVRRSEAMADRMGGTDCALPILDALKNKIPVDVFQIYTDSETWAGNIHPSAALRKYRDAMGIPAKLVVVGMVSNGFSIADPRDAGMLDVVGFDTATPNVIADFVRG